MKKQVLCAIGDSLYEADVNFKREGFVEKLSLSCSPLDKAWTKKALEAPQVVVTNDGDGLKVTFSDGKDIYLDYSQVVELRAALHIEGSFDKKPTTFKKWIPA